VAAPAIPALIPALREEEWSRRLEIIDALYFIGSVATPALVDALRHPHWAVRAGAAEVLGRFESWVAREKDREQARPVASGVLAALTAALNDYHPEVLRKAADALSSICAPDVEPAIPAFIDVLRDPRHPEHRDVTLALAHIGLPAVARAVPVLIDLLKDPNPGVRCSAASALGGLKIMAAGNVLMEMLGDQARDDQPESDTTPLEVRLIAANALAEIGASAVPPALPLLRAALPVLHAALREGDSSERSVALRALTLLGPLAAETVPDLIRVLGLRSVDWRAAEVLANIGPLASDAVSALEAALCDSDEYVRSSAATALGRIGLPSAGRAIPALLRLLDDRDNDVRDCAAEALAKLGRIAPATN
jgi:HEAT repeat protein